MTERDSDDVIRGRMVDLIREEAGKPLAWWYLSYSGVDKFNGGVIIEATGFASAVVLSGELGISPGGEVTGIKIPPDELPPDRYRHRCLSLEELGEFWEMENLKRLTDDE